MHIVCSYSTCPSPTTQHDSNVFFAEWVHFADLNLLHNALDEQDLQIQKSGYFLAENIGQQFRNTMNPEVPKQLQDLCT